MGTPTQTRAMADGGESDAVAPAMAADGDVAAAAAAAADGGDDAAAAATAAPASDGGYKAVWRSLTPYERRLTWEHRVLGVLWEIKFGLVSATRAGQLIYLCQGDQARMAFADAIMWSGDGILNVISQPLVGALSDAYGRKLFMALGRVSLIWWCLGTRASKTLPQYIFNDIAPYPLFGSSLSVQAASLADVFGTRPELSSQLAARSQIFVSAAGLVGPLLGAAIVVRSRLGGWYAGAIAGAIETVIVLSMSETLKPEKRTPFKWANANPFGSLTLLFRHGPGLRRLALSSLCFNACTTTYSTMDSYRLGPLGWTPPQQSLFSSFLSATNMASTAFVTGPLLARHGNRQVFQGASAVAALAYFLLGQSWRGSSQLQMTVQYCVAKVILQTPWSEPSRAAIKPMVLKQGIHVAGPSGVGRGQLSAAYDTIDSVLSATMPLVWGGLFSLLLRQPADSLIGRVLGPGGHFTIAAIVRLISRQILVSARDEDLFLEDEDEDEDKEA